MTYDLGRPVRSGMNVALKHLRMQQQEEEGERHRIVIQHFLEAITDRGLPQHPPLCQWRTSIRRQVNSRYTDGYETGPGSA